MKLNTGKIKQFIVEIASTHPGVIGELESHEIDGTNPKRWKRVEKRKMREDDLERVEHLFDEWPEHLRDQVTNWTSVKQDELIGCIVRVFNIEDEGGAAIFVAVTDPKDERIVAWDLNVD